LGEPIRVSVFITNHSETAVTLRLPGSDSPDHLESYFRHHGSVALWRERQPLPSTFREKGIIDTARETVLPPGERAGLVLNVRELFRLPFQESGNYRLEAQCDSFSATVEFSITPNPRVFLRETLLWNGPSGSGQSTEFVCLAPQRPKTTGYTLAQRFDGQPFAHILTVDTVPFQLKPVKLVDNAATTEGVLLLWVGRDSILRAIPPYLLWRTPIELKDCTEVKVEPASTIEKVEVAKGKEREYIDLWIQMSNRDRRRTTDIYLRYQTYAFHPIGEDEFLRTKQAIAEQRPN